MSEFSCPVVRIEWLKPVPNSDALDFTQVYETNVIVRKGQLKTGDLAVYIPLDSMVPMAKPQFQGLGIKSERELYRVKAVRLRGTYSEGLLVPLNPSDHGPYQNKDLYVGFDMAEAWGITKYEEPETPTAIQGTKGAQQDKDITWAPRYNVEPLVKNRHAIPEGMDVVVTEKLHGCVSPNARILMSDGSYRRMKDVRVGDTVLGRDGNGALVSSRVLEKFDNGTTNTWLEFRTTNENAGRGLSYRVFRCTPNHRVWVNGDYVPASDIFVGDTVQVARLDMTLNPLQEQVLIGKMLGDGNFSNKAIRWGHSSAQSAYSDWTAQCLGMLAHPTVQSGVSGYGSDMVVRRTVSSDLVEQLGRRFVPNQNKIVPRDIVLTPISLAFWYMDDGSLSHTKGQEDRASFAVCGFDRTSVDRLAVALARLGVESTVTGEDGRLRLQVGARSAELMFSLIAPYIHPTLQYKLPERFRGGPAWFPKIEFQTQLVPQKIVKITRRTESLSVARLDMSTETENYFVGGVLVHNCNGRYVYGPDVHGTTRLIVGSHNVWKRPFYSGNAFIRKLKTFANKLGFQFKLEEPINDDVWWTIAKRLDLAAKLAKYPKLVVYGEVYGAVQDLKYSVPADEKVAFRVFDMYDANTKSWLRHQEVVSLCAVLGLEHVPVLYKGPYNPEVDRLRSGKSTVDGVTLREGFVIRPLNPVDPKDKSAYKYVSEEYKLRKGVTTEFH